MNIRKRKNSYQFVLYLGKDQGDKQQFARMTYKPPKGLTAKQEKLAVMTAAADFENRIKGGQAIQYDKLKFKDFITLYVKSHINTLKPKTAAGYITIINNRLLPYFGNMLVRDITPLDVRKWLSELDRQDNKQSSDLSANSKGVYFRTLSAILGKAVEYQIITSNPCQSIKQPRKQQSDVKALQLDEVRQLLSVINDYEDKRAVTAVYILIFTGVRVSELCGLKWQDVDFTNKVIHIRRECIYIPGEGVRVDTPKSKTSVRDIYIPEILCQRLREYKQEQDREILIKGSMWQGPQDNSYLLTQFDGKPVHDSTIRSWVKKVMSFCEVPYITVHGLRHTFASLLISNGVDVRTTAAQLGHSSPALVYNTYANPQNNAKRQAADSLEKLVILSS